MGEGVFFFCNIGMFAHGSCEQVLRIGIVVSSRLLLAFQGFHNPQTF